MSKELLDLMELARALDELQGEPPQLTEGELAALRQLETLTPERLDYA